MRLLYRTDIFMIGLYLEKLRSPIYRVEFEVKQLWEPPVTNWDNCIYGTGSHKCSTRSDRAESVVMY